MQEEEKPVRKGQQRKTAPLSRVGAHSHGGIFEYDGIRYGTTKAWGNKIYALHGKQAYKQWLKHVEEQKRKDREQREQQRDAKEREKLRQRTEKAKEKEKQKAIQQRKRIEQIATKGKRKRH